MPTIQTIGEHLDLGDTAVKDWLKRLGLSGKDSLDTIRVAYIKGLRASASAHAEGASGDALTQERARLAREQADRVAMENAVRRRELAPRALMVDAIADGARQMVAILEGVPAQIKRASSDIKARELAIVKREIDKARNAIADIQLS